jgi:aspartyl-tRNA(Asn)/glutamyl-tRNA(Gln) amidotransferase subunit C
MPGEIDDRQVRRIARLSRLDLSPEEARLFAGQLTRILEYFEQLQAVDTEGVEPLVHAVPVADVVREDLPGPAFDTDKALRNAPQREGRFFKVPPVLDQASGA